jgi:2-polyprenyl-6-methoxyphenol hydroxylase-like FAD-dependent oxidoreductase
MQSAVIGAAAAAGATVRRGARVVGLVSDGLPGVRVHEAGNGERVYRARLVVGADGRNSVCRRWGGFHVERDSEGMVIAGLLMQDLAAPEDQMSSFLNPRLSMLSLTVPLGAGRFRAYVSIHKDARESTAAPLSGEANIPAFIGTFQTCRCALRASGAGDRPEVSGLPPIATRLPRNGRDLRLSGLRQAAKSFARI